MCQARGHPFTAAQWDKASQHRLQRSGLGQFVDVLVQLLQQLKAQPPRRATFRVFTRQVYVQYCV